MLLVAVHACSERTPASVNSATNPASAAIAPPDATPAAPTADTGAALALDGEGLRVIRLSSGSTLLVSFGDERSTVIPTASRLVGGPPSTVTANVDCRTTVATWPASGLQLWFSADSAARFVGWSLGGIARADTSAPNLTTMSGIGIGSTRAALDSVYVATVARSSLGVEFNAAGIAGLLASAQPDAQIRNLWAGQVCLAR